MPDRSRQPAFPFARSAGVLTLVALVSGTLAAVVVWACFGSAAQVYRAVAVTGGVAYVTAILGVAPVAVLGPMGVMPTVFAYFAGAAVRVVVCVLACVVCIKGLALPAGPVAVGLVGVYLPLLFVEAGLVGRYVWEKDAHGRDAQAASTGAFA